MAEQFKILVKIGYQIRSFIVEHIPIDDRTQHFKLIGRNKSILLESNRPLFRKKGLKHRKPNWKVIEGKVDFQSSLDPFIGAIMKQVEPEG